MTHPAKPGLYLKSITVCLFFLLSLTGNSQDAVLSANDNAIGDGGMVSYSVGLVAFRNVEAASGFVTEGVQQPYEILFMTGIDDITTISLDCMVYPNPATSEVKLKIARLSVEQLSYQLKSSSGVILNSMKIVNNETIIPLSELPSGIYLLTLLENEENLTTWKVIKK